jgi:hypothetical protein
VDTATVLTGILAIFTTGLTTWGTMRIAQNRAKIDMGSDVTSRFDKLTNQLQEEREYLEKRVVEQRAVLAAVMVELDTCQRTARRMIRHIEELEGQLETARITPKPRVGFE